MPLTKSTIGAEGVLMGGLLNVLGQQVTPADDPGQRIRDVHERCEPVPMAQKADSDPIIVMGTGEEVLVGKPPNRPRI